MCSVGFRYSPMLGPGGVLHSVARGLKHMIILCYLHDILGYFCIHKGAYHSLPFSHTQEGEP